LFVKCRKSEHAWVRSGALPAGGRRPPYRLHWGRSPRPPEVAVKRKWLILTLGAALAAAALLVWLGVEDARQATLLEIQKLQAVSRGLRAETQLERLTRDGATEEEVAESAQEADEAWADVERLSREQARRQQSWHARLVREVRRRTGW